MIRIQAVLESPASAVMGLAGDVVRETVPTLVAVLQAVTAYSERVVVDLSYVRTVDQDGLNALREWSAGVPGNAARSGVHLVLANLFPAVGRTLADYGLAAPRTDELTTVTHPGR